jgi:hypothetical protein
MKGLFQKVLQHSNGWDQIQKEAMIDLCLLGMYSDDSITLAEQDFIENEGTQLQWTSGISFGGYLQRVIPKVRSAKGNSPKTTDLLQSISDRLGSDELKRSAVDELEKLLASDGVAVMEETFLAEVKRVLAI